MIGRQAGRPLDQNTTHKVTAATAPTSKAGAATDQSCVDGTLAPKADAASQACSQ